MPLKPGFISSRAVLIAAPAIAVMLVLLVTMQPINTTAQSSTPEGTADATALATSAATAQATAVNCSQILPAVSKNLAENCKDTAPDSLCYANQTIHIDTVDANSTPNFSKVGDTIPLSEIKSITTAPLNLNTGEWGLGVMRFQAKVPGVTGGQVVTFVVYGNTKVVGFDKQTISAQPTPTPTMCSANTTRISYLRADPDLNAQKGEILPPGSDLMVTGRTSDNQWLKAFDTKAQGWIPTTNVKMTCELGIVPIIDDGSPVPMSGPGAFYFSTTVSPEASCQNVPTGGLLIQSPGGRKVQFQLNGADVTIGSTVLFTIDNTNPQAREMDMTVLAGQAWVQTHEHNQTAVTGQTMGIGLDQTGKPDGKFSPAGIDLPTYNAGCIMARVALANDVCAANRLATPTAK